MLDTAKFRCLQRIQVQELCLPRAFDAFLRFGAANRPNVLRALVAQLIALWKQDPGILYFVRGALHLHAFWRKS